MSRRIFCFFVFIVAISLSSCGPDKAPEGPEPFVVGMELAYPPFEMRDSENQPDGISVRMAEALAEKLGRPLEIRDVEWNGIIPALQSGKIDAIISSMTRTPERAKAIAFSDGYVTNGLCMLVKKDSPIKSGKDLESGDYTASVKIGTTGHQWARQALPDMDLVVLDNSAACVLEVVQGKTDVFIYDQISIYQYWKNNEEVTRPILQPIREETWAIGLRKEDTELMNDVNAFLAEFRERGEFDVLAERYMSEAKAAFEEMGVPFIFH